MSKQIEPPQPESVESINLREALEERYLAYALSTIMHRALPDVRDGLKPVHRRLLYAHAASAARSGLRLQEVRRVVGDVIGKYHPHGDQAVYDAMVRLAQDFAVALSADRGAGQLRQYRRRQCRCLSLHRGAADRCRAWRCSKASTRTPSISATPTTARTAEPVVLPGAFPNLLANGSSGIAVGMATSIPPHNAAELCDAALHLIKSPNATVDKLVQFVPGPDFPTGGIIVDDRATILEAYKTGADRSACARAGSRRIPGAASGRSSSPRFPTRCRKAG